MGDPLFREHGKQVAALCWRPSQKHGSAIEVLLITSLNSKRWILPKGWPEPELGPAENDAREAFEEAGVLGLVGRRSLGSFRYKKRLKKGRVTVCIVHVFPLNVARQRLQWPEKNQREIKWVSVKEAAEAVRNVRLSEIIRRWAQMTAAPKRRAPLAAATKSSIWRSQRRRRS